MVRILPRHHGPPRLAARARSAVGRLWLRVPVAWVVVCLAAGSCRSCVTREARGDASPPAFAAPRGARVVGFRGTPSPLVWASRASHRAARSRSTTAPRAAGEMIPPTGMDPEKVAEAMRQIPGAEATPKPGDLLGAGIFSFIIPLVVGLVAVYLLLLFKPEAVLSDKQMIDFKRIEKKEALKKRGAKNLDGQEGNRAIRRKKLREKLRGKSTPSDDD
mmetsp:Transcript_88253/g.274327  ORF Transcript_88253/g.274327 Transcript_88253/m.274327 type:complete len:218 (+) Transcript_88253:75-728(+)